MRKELWLEFGFVHRKQNNYHDMLWYNEGRWQEFPYFIKHYISDFFKPDRYFLIRYGKLEIYLRK